MNSVDYEILERLSANGRETVAEIGRAIGLSAASTHARLKNLEATGVIKGYSVVLDRERVDVNVIAFVEITTTPFASSADQQNFESYFVENDAVLECHDCTGGFSYLAKIAARDLKTLREIISEIRALPCASVTSSAISMTTIKDNGPLPLSYANGA